MFDESKHPRDEMGKFTDGAGGTHIPTEAELQRLREMGVDEQKGQLQKDRPKEECRKTPAEKIASVHIDFDRDNVLPELNEEDLQKIGVDKNKPVLLKKFIIDRNEIRHPDITKDDVINIIANALYAPSEIFHGKSEKPYYHFAKVIEITSKGKSEIGLVLLDVDENKDNFEIVHAHFVNATGFRQVKKDIKKD